MLGDGPACFVCKLKPLCQQESNFNKVHPLQFVAGAFEVELNCESLVFIVTFEDLIQRADFHTTASPCAHVCQGWCVQYSFNLCWVITSLIVYSLEQNQDVLYF